MKYNLLYYPENGNIGNTVQTLSLSGLIKPSTRISYKDIKNNDDELLICNGWFQSLYQKIDLKTKAIFAGIHLTDWNGYDNLLFIEWIKQSKKIIGARDPDTAIYLNSIGIKAEFIGCSSLLFSRYDGPRNDVIFVDYNNPSLTHNITEPITFEEDWKRTIDLLNKYKTARAVYTTRLHVVLPCLAFGTPVCIIPNNDKRRFSILDYLGVKYNELFQMDVTKLAKIYKSFIDTELGIVTNFGEPVMPEIKK